MHVPTPAASTVPFTLAPRLLPAVSMYVLTYAEVSYKSSDRALSFSRLDTL